MDIERTLRDVAHSYPIAWLAASRIKDIPRVAFQIRLALNGTAPSNVSVCDIGGGVGLFSIGCAALGMKVVVIDDFEEHSWYWNNGGADLHKRYGVSVICRDVVKVGVSDINEHFDIVTTFDTMEHWHHSPKALFRQIRGGLLKPGGRFVLGVPNCVNLRKRITTPLGYNKWSGMDAWYEQEVFRGHVREPDVDDLRYIARDMKLRDVKISGRNWLGYRSRFKPVRVLTPFADHMLRVFPSLCSDLYLTGTVWVAAKPDRLQEQHASASFSFRRGLFGRPFGLPHSPGFQRFPDYRSPRSSNGVLDCGSCRTVRSCRQPRGGYLPTRISRSMVSRVASSASQVPSDLRLSRRKGNHISGWL